MGENPAIHVVSVGIIHRLQISTPCNDHTSAWSLGLLVGLRVDGEQHKGQ
jgi:hypothetical protein